MPRPPLPAAGGTAARGGVGARRARPGHGSTIRLAPPLTVTTEELRSALGVPEKVLAV
ncbi:hypothetical protein AB0N16_31280 [Streptomyces sp. NPDC051105]|uniref:hypothetical protein n=1 Tax=Streptomyces sp. NPDC051105 TaxID=3154843 RepID=UPI00343A58FB